MKGTPHFSRTYSFQAWIHSLFSFRFFACHKGWGLKAGFSLATESESESESKAESQERLWPGENQKSESQAES